MQVLAGGTRGLPAPIPRYPPRAPLREGMRRTRPANDHRGCCSAKDYQIRGRSGVLKVVAQCGAWPMFDVKIQRRIVHSLAGDVDK